MAVQVTISNITGQSPYDIYICQTGGTSCFYMTTITSAPYIFDIPAPYNTSDAYMLKIIDYLTIKEAAEFVGVTTNTLRNWEKDKKITVYRNPQNKYRLYKKEDLENLLNTIKQA